MKMINSKEENNVKSLLRNKLEKIHKKKKLKRIWAEVISLYPCEACIIFIDIR